MAKFNEVLVGRYNRYLQKLLQIKGNPPSAQLSTEIGVQIGLFHGVETRYLEGWDTFWASGIVGPFAAIHSTLQFRNPSGVNTMMVIERLRYGIGTTGDAVIVSQAGGNPADLANSFSGSRMDARTLRGSAAVLTFNSTVDGTDLANVVWAENITANVPVDLISSDSDTQIILAPGDAIRFRDTTVNSFIRVSIRWRERFLEDSERA